MVQPNLTICKTSGERLDGVDSETAAQKLRGRVGTIVTVKVHDVSTKMLLNGHTFGMALVYNHIVDRTHIIGIILEDKR